MNYKYNPTSFSQLVACSRNAGNYWFSPEQMKEKHPTVRMMCDTNGKYLYFIECTRGIEVLSGIYNTIYSVCRFNKATGSINYVRTEDENLDRHTLKSIPLDKAVELVQLLQIGKVAEIG